MPVMWGRESCQLCGGGHYLFPLVSQQALLLQDWILLLHSVAQLIKAFSPTLMTKKAGGTH